MTEQDEPNIYQLLDRLKRAKEGVNEEVPGWRIRRPTTDEMSDTIATLIADSTEGEHEPLLLPRTVELCIAVKTGVAVIEGEFLQTGRFYVIRGDQNRFVKSLAHPTSIYCFFFAGSGVDESPMAAR
jgi:hypothetical protein